MEYNESDHIRPPPPIYSSTSARNFGWIEYSVFSSLLGLSLAIGIYYGFVKKSQNTTVEYILAGKSMKVLPIAASLVTSHVSGISLLGVPAEMYDYGTAYMTICVGYLLVIVITNVFILPVFYPLQLTSLYEYLELRFSMRVRKFTSFIFALAVLIMNPVIIFVPAIAFHQATGISIHHFAPVICFICIFYTAVGGLKSVVWTDTIQGMFTLSSIIIIAVLGVIEVGGFRNIYQSISAGDRLEFFNMDPNPLLRNSFWTTTIGGFFQMMMAIPFHPGSVQRFTSIPTMKSAKHSVYLFALGMFILKVLTCVIGLAMYTKYSTCDPVLSQRLEKSGELVPYYVQETGHNVPGLTAVFISGLISAALSVISANLNTMAGTIYEDIISPYLSPKSKEAKANFTMKAIVIIAGIECVLMVYVVEHLGTILQMAITLSGITQGAMISVFIMGLFMPWIDEKGAFYGTVASVICTTWLVMNNQLAIYNHHLVFDKKPLDLSGCKGVNDSFSFLNATMSEFVEVANGVHLQKNLPHIYALSYLYYNVVGVIVALVVASLWALIIRNDLQDVDHTLITPMLRPILPKPVQTIKVMEKYTP